MEEEGAKACYLKHTTRDMLRKERVNFPSLKPALRAWSGVFAND
jgi:hypothetical protein